METMTVTNEKTLQQGLNDVVINKVQKMIDGKAVGVQATMERLINEGKIAQDYIAPIGVNLRQKDHSFSGQRLDKGTVQQREPDEESLRDTGGFRN